MAVQNPVRDLITHRRRGDPPSVAPAKTTVAGIFATCRTGDVTRSTHSFRLTNSRFRLQYTDARNGLCLAYLVSTACLLAAYAGGLGD